MTDADTPPCTGLSPRGDRCSHAARFRVRASADVTYGSRACPAHLAQVIDFVRADGPVTVDVARGWLEGERP
ncbi:hypothetical protein [Amycolatopsis jejuensis]|uniref:hypothetical protein n=1 Tax=Amycolatopsis jejuensis TaxID=330084 RepID=UPI0005266077|nr:hypothetical protein [Amycolatopsis jejuensis]